MHEHLEVQRRERLDWWSAEPVVCPACVAADAGDGERAATLIGFSEAMPVVPVAEGELCEFVLERRAAVAEM